MNETPDRTIFYYTFLKHYIYYTLIFPYEFYYTGWSLLTITNVRYSELGKVPYLDSVVC